MKKTVLLSLLSLFMFTGCHYYGGGVVVDGSYSYNHHTPAYGQRRNFHRYHYYPYADIYFDTGRNMYFYLDNRAHWSFSVNLPLYLHSHLDRGYVEIEMEADRPYLKHQYYKNKYRNKKYKSKYKYRKNYKRNSGYKSGVKKNYRYQDKTYRNKNDRHRSNDSYKRKDSYRSKDEYKNKEHYKDKYRNKDKYKNKSNNQSDEKKYDRKKRDRRNERD